MRAVEISQGKVGTRLPADQQERIAGYHLAKADEIAIGSSFVGVHDPHRPAPGDIHCAGEKTIGCLRRRGGADEFDRHTLLAITTERQGGVVRRVEQPAQILLQSKRHSRYLAAHRIFSAASAKTWAPSTMSSALLSSDQ